MAPKTGNQGGAHPSLYGINGRLDVWRGSTVCRHGSEHLWRLRSGGPWRCDVCHPPAIQEIERARQREGV